MKLSDFGKNAIFIVDPETYYWTIWTKGLEPLNLFKVDTVQDVVLVHENLETQSLEKTYFRDLVLRSIQPISTEDYFTEIVTVTRSWHAPEEVTPPSGRKF